MGITREMENKARVLAMVKAKTEAERKKRAEGLEELYTQFLKENALDGYVRLKTYPAVPRSKAHLFVKIWDDGYVEIRLKFEIQAMDHCACECDAADPLQVMQEILEQYVPFEKENDHEQTD